MDYDSQKWQRHLIFSEIGDKLPFCETLLAFRLSSIPAFQTKIILPEGSKKRDLG